MSSEDPLGGRGEWLQVALGLPPEKLPPIRKSVPIGSHPKEANPFFKDGGDGKAPRENVDRDILDSTLRVGDGGRGWRLGAQRRARHLKIHSSPGQGAPTEDHREINGRERKIWKECPGGHLRDRGDKANKKDTFISGEHQIKQAEDDYDPYVTKRRHRSQRAPHRFEAGRIHSLKDNEDDNSSRRLFGDRTVKEHRTMTTQWQKKSPPCSWCLENEKKPSNFPLLSASNLVHIRIHKPYSVSEPWLYLVPNDHLRALTAMDNDALESLRNYQKSLIRFFESFDLLPVFVEAPLEVPSSDVELTGRGPHTVVEVWPIWSSAIKTAETYFFKTFSDFPAKGTESARIIRTTGRQGPVGHIPPRFAYVFVDLPSLPGFLHLVEEEDHDYRDHVRQTVDAIRDVAPEVRNFLTTRLKSHDLINSFEKFDWTKQ